MPTIGNLLQRYTNYRTYWTGKWHLGHATQSHLPLQRGFEKFYGFYTSNLDYNDKTISSTYYDTDYMDWRNMDNIDYETQYDYSTFVTGDYMLDIINSHVSEYSIDTPFYLQVPFQAVHATLATVESENSDTCNSIANANRQLVCQAILAVDEVIGKLTKNLKHETNVWDNTMIVFTSDNGGTFRKVFDVLFCAFRVSVCVCVVCFVFCVFLRLVSLYCNYFILFYFVFCCFCIFDVI